MTNRTASAGDPLLARSRQIWKRSEEANASFSLAFDFEMRPRQKQPEGRNPKLGPEWVRLGEPNAPPLKTSEARPSRSRNPHSQSRLLRNRAHGSDRAGGLLPRLHPGPRPPVRAPLFVLQHQSPMLMRSLRAEIAHRQRAIPFSLSRSSAFPGLPTSPGR